MIRNTLLYNASLALVEAAKFVKPIDSEYAIELLDKAEEFKNQIEIDEELEKEVKNFEERIKEGL
jgi:hypothetical protein